MLTPQQIAELQAEAANLRAQAAACQVAGNQAEYLRLIEEAESAEKLIADAQADAAIPTKIEMVQSHGFIDENKVNHFWKQGMTVTNPADIALLVSRKAVFKVVP